MTVWAKPEAAAPPAPEAPPEGYFADLFDGESALRRRVEVEITPRALHVRPPEGAPLRWDRDALHRPPAPRGGPVVIRHGRARLVATGSAAETFARAIPPGRASVPRLWPRALAALAGAGGALALLVLAGLPALASLLAPWLDADAEVALGDAHWEQVTALFGLDRCADPAGEAALAAMVERVAAPLDLPYDLRVVVLDDRAKPTLNAFAVAGGRVAFFDGMIQAAEHPDEIAAVLAHELGHVVHRDTVRGLLQSASALAVLSVLAGDVTGGGALGGLAGVTVSAGYTRRAERRADAFAADLLARADLPPSALATMFARLGEAHGDGPSGALGHIATHPAIPERIDALSGLRDPGGPPSLAPAEWAALRGICGPLAASRPLR